MKKLSETWKQKKPFVGLSRTASNSHSGQTGVKLSNTGTKRLGRVAITSSGRSANSAIPSGKEKAKSSDVPDISISSSFALDLDKDIIDAVDSLEAAAYEAERSKKTRGTALELNQQLSPSYRTPTRQVSSSCKTPTRQGGHVGGNPGKRKNSRSRKSFTRKPSLFDDTSSSSSLLNEPFTPTHSPLDKRRRSGAEELVSTTDVSLSVKAPAAVSLQKSRFLCPASPSPELSTAQHHANHHRYTTSCSSVSQSASVKPGLSKTGTPKAIAGHQNVGLEEEEAVIETDVSPVLCVDKPGIHAGHNDNNGLGRGDQGVLSKQTDVSSECSSKPSHSGVPAADLRTDLCSRTAAQAEHAQKSSAKPVPSISSQLLENKQDEEKRGGECTQLKPNRLNKENFPDPCVKTCPSNSKTKSASPRKVTSSSAGKAASASTGIQLKNVTNGIRSISKSESDSKHTSVEPGIKKSTENNKKLEHADSVQVLPHTDHSSTAQNKTRTVSKPDSPQSVTSIVNQLPDGTGSKNTESLSLSSWGLPGPVLSAYHSQGITAMFPWQAQCLTTGSVLAGGNLVYSAPTSAGKTMVAELLMLKRVLETRRKALFILPFVSVTREKAVSLQRLYQDAGVRVGGFMGGYSPAGGFRGVDVAVCTIEKGNGLINRLMEGNRIDELGVVVIDELHMVGDSNRGYLLELLLTKICYMARRSRETSQHPIQVIGMSATLPNLDLLASWLDANLYHTDFRPVPLTEHVKVGTTVYDQAMNKVRDIKVKATFKGDDDHIIPLCLETILEGHAVLIFCPSKVWCEKTAEKIAREFYGILKNPATLAAYSSNTGFVKASEMVQLPIDQAALHNVLEQLGRSPVGMDPMLGKVIQYGVAYHHAGLTFDERDIVEGAFRQGLLKILVATSTLSSGVNLPARRVIVRSPMFGGRPMDALSYKQMAGRAGRKGVDTEGECVLVCKEGEKKVAQHLLKTTLPPVTSCLQSSAEGTKLSRSMKRAVLEVVVSGVASTPDDIARYVACTLLSASLPPDDNSTSALVASCLAFLEDNEFVSLRTTKTADDQDVQTYQPTQLGSAVLASSMSPDEGLAVFAELQKARQSFVLANELHIIYLVTPIYSQEISGNLDWYHFYCLWEKLPPDMHLVARTVGVEEGFLAKAITGRIPTKTAAQARAVAVHRRFYTALALHDLVHEVPLLDVAARFHCNKGQLQSLMQSAATFAGMVTVFCERLGWSNMELLLSQFQQRLTLGITRELCDLVRIPLLTGTMARMLFNAGYQTVAAVAHATPQDVETVFRKASPFQSTKQQEGESDWEMEQRRKARCVWLAGHKGVTELEAAVAIVDEAKTIIQQELGVKIHWQDRATDVSVTEDRSDETSEDLSVSRTMLKKGSDASFVSKESPGISSRHSPAANKVSPAAAEQRIGTESSKESPTSPPSASKRKRRSSEIFQTPATTNRSRRPLSCRSASRRNSGGAKRTTPNAKSPPSGGGAGQNSASSSEPRGDHSPREVSFFGQVVVSPPPALRRQLAQNIPSPRAAEDGGRVDAGENAGASSTPKTSGSHAHPTPSVKLAQNTPSPVEPEHWTVTGKKESGKSVSMPKSSFHDACGVRLFGRSGGLGSGSHSQEKQRSVTSTDVTAGPGSNSAYGVESLTSDGSTHRKARSKVNVLQGKNEETPDNPSMKFESENGKRGDFGGRLTEHSTKDEQTHDNQAKPTSATGISKSRLYHQASVPKACNSVSERSSGLKSSASAKGQSISTASFTAAVMTATCVNTTKQESDTSTKSSLPSACEDDDVDNCFDDSLILNTQTDKLLSGGLSNSKSVSDESFEHASASTPLVPVISNRKLSGENISQKFPEAKTPNPRLKLNKAPSPEDRNKVILYGKNSPKDSTTKMRSSALPIEQAAPQTCTESEPVTISSLKNPQHQGPPELSASSPPFLEEDNFMEDMFGSPFVSISAPAGNQEPISSLSSAQQSARKAAESNVIEEAKLDQVEIAEFDHHSDNDIVTDSYNNSDADVSAELFAASNYERIPYAEEGVIRDSPDMSFQDFSGTQIAAGSGHLVCAERDPEEREEEGTAPQTLAKPADDIRSEYAAELNINEDLAMALNLSESFSSVADSGTAKQAASDGFTCSKQKESCDGGRDIHGVSSSFTASMMEKAFADDTFCDPAEEAKMKWQLAVKQNRSQKDGKQAESVSKTRTDCSSDVPVAASTTKSSDHAPLNQRDFITNVHPGSSTSPESKRSSTGSINPQDGECVPPTPPDETGVSSPCIRRTPLRACRTKGQVSQQTTQAVLGSHCKEKSKNHQKPSRKTKGASQGTRRALTGSSGAKSTCDNNPQDRLVTVPDKENIASDVTAADSHGSEEAQTASKVPQTDVDSPPLTQESLCVIDVCSNKDLFATFVAEWRGQSAYAMSVACEKKPSPVLPGGGIGGRFMQGKSDNNPELTTTKNGTGIPGDEDRMLVGLAVSWDAYDAYYISLVPENAADTNASLDDTLAAPPCTQSISIRQRTQTIHDILQLTLDTGSSHTVTVYDSKSTYSVLARGLGAVFGRCRDPQVANWLMDPGATEKTLHSMVTNFLPADLPLLEGVGGSIGYGGLGLTVKNSGTGRMRAVVESVLARRLMDHFWAQLSQAGLQAAFSGTEMPSLLTMARMELNGFGFSQEECESQKNMMLARLATLEQEAYTLAKHPFSLTSLDDIAQVLFLELQLPVNGDPSAAKPSRTLGPNRRAAASGRQKSAFSTSKDVLEKLKPYDPLPGVILQWRQLSAALTKHVYPLQKEMVRSPTLDMPRIFSLCQLHTATGRVSMTEPNLQNIPKDFDILLPDVIGESPPATTHAAASVAVTSASKAKNSRLQAIRGITPQTARVTDPSKATHTAVSMRHAFVPFHGGVMLAADYSQLELRVIAHLSGDRKLISILNNDGDVFKMIAAQWKNTLPEAVTAQERQQAKQICYGMLYGIGAKALGEQIGVDENDATVFMESFKAKYTGMRTYLRQTVEQCREKGYVTTVTGRRRYLPAIKDTNPHARAQAERQAVNTTVQGSAADIVKAAMIGIDRELREVFPDTRFPHRHFHADARRPRGAFLVLQLHDELIYEVSKPDVTQVVRVIRQHMESTTPLAVRLPVKVKVGPSWGRLEDVDL